MPAISMTQADTFIQYASFETYQAIIFSDKSTGILQDDALGLMMIEQPLLLPPCVQCTSVGLRDAAEINYYIGV